MADKVAGFGGSWKFIVAFAMFLFIWIVANVYLLGKAFYPSFYSAKPVAVNPCSTTGPYNNDEQNRKEENDRPRAVNDYMINLKAEIEVRKLHGKLDFLMTEQMKTLFEIQKTQLDLMEEIKSIVNIQNIQPAKNNAVSQKL